MSMNKKSLFNKLIISAGFLIIPFFIMLIVLTMAVQLSNKQQAVFFIGSSIEGFGDYFAYFRCGIIVLILTFWKELVRNYGKRKGLSLKQIYFIKKLYPMIVLSIFITELLGFCL